MTSAVFRIYERLIRVHRSYHAALSFMPNLFVCNNAPRYSLSHKNRSSPVQRRFLSGDRKDNKYSDNQFQEKRDQEDPSTAAAATVNTEQHTKSASSQHSRTPSSTITSKALSQPDKEQLADILRNVLQSQVPQKSNSEKEIMRAYEQMRKRFSSETIEQLSDNTSNGENVTTTKPTHNDLSRHFQFLQETITVLPTAETELSQINDDYAHISTSGEHDADIEDLKIITFEHLTRLDIRRHADKLRGVTTPWQEPLPEQFVTFETRNYYHAGSDATHIPAARKVVLKVEVAKLSLDAAAQDKFLQLVGQRYNPQTDILTISGDRFPTREMNKKYLKDLLTVLVAEAKVVVHAYCYLKFSL